MVADHIKQWYDSVQLFILIFQTKATSASDSSLCLLTSLGLPLHTIIMLGLKTVSAIETGVYNLLFIISTKPLVQRGAGLLTGVSHVEVIFSMI